MLGISLLGLLYRREGKRAFWQGFAIFGWGYLVLTHGPWFDNQVGPRLPTTQFLSYAHEKLNADPNQAGTAEWLRQISTISQPPNPPLTVQVFKAGSVTSANGAGQSFRFLLVSSNVEQFVRVGQCLFTILAALTGAAIARWFRRTNRITPR